MYRCYQKEENEKARLYRRRVWQLTVNHKKHKNKTVSPKMAQVNFIRKWFFFIPVKDPCVSVAKCLWHWFHWILSNRGRVDGGCLWICRLAHFSLFFFWSSLDLSSSPAFASAQAAFDWLTLRITRLHGNRRTRQHWKPLKRHIRALQKSRAPHCKHERRQQHRRATRKWVHALVFPPSLLQFYFRHRFSTPSPDFRLHASAPWGRARHLFLWCPFFHSNPSFNPFLNNSLTLFCMKLFHYD